MREWLASALLRSLWYAVAALPAGVTEALAVVLGRLYQLAAPRQRRRLGLNVQRVYGLPSGTHFAATFCAQVFRQQVVCGLETLQAIRRPQRLQLSGWTELKALVAQAEARGRGHIMVTAHLGSWELCAYYAQLAASRPLQVLAKPAKQAWLTRFLADVRTRMGTHVLWTDRKTLLRDMLGALKRAESLGFVMDQKPAHRQGPVVDFLGQPTEFVSGPAQMARRAACPVIAIFCVREGPLRYRLLSQELCRDGSQLSELALTAACAAAIDQAVRAYPEQWTWTYKRWRETI